MSDLYFEYECADGSAFKGFIQALHITPSGKITIYFGAEYQQFFPVENDVYRCGDSYRWIKQDKNARWFKE